MIVRTALFILLVMCAALLSAQNWTTYGDLPGTGRYDDIVYATPDKGWVCGSDGKVYRTEDGGLTWTIVYQDYYTAYMRAIDFIDESTGFVGSLNGLVLMTTDAGDSWTEIQDSIPGPVTGVCGLSHFGENVYGVGAFFYPAFFIKSEDAGETWTYLDMSAHVDGLVDCHFVSDQVGFASGIRESEGSVILKTEDGGATWTEKFNSGSGSEYLWKMFFVNDMVIYGSIESFFSVGTQIVKSTDAGETWTIKDVTTDMNMDIQGIGFIDEMKGWVGPRNEPIYETIDGGETWYPLTGYNNINRFFRLDDGPLYATGHTQYRYDDVIGLMENDHFVDHGLSVAPNPVSDHFRVDVNLTARTFVKLGLYDLNGRLIQSIEDQYLPSGPHSFQLDAQSLSGIKAGAHLIFLRTNEGFQSVKVQVLK